MSDTVVTVTPQVNTITVSGEHTVTVENTQVEIVTTGTQGPEGIPGPAGASGETLPWTQVTSSTQQMAALNGYIANNASQVTLTLPALAAVGDYIRVVGKGAGGWKIAQNSGQTIHFGSKDSTTGTGGSLTSQNTFDCAEILCITQNSDWEVLSAQGNLTVT